MQGYSPKIPFVKDSIDGFSTNKTALETIKQDLKMLLLTNPGERIMNPKFGVGLRRFLFEQKTPTTFSLINQIINQQVNQYMSFISIQSIDVNPIPDSENSISVKVSYYIPTLNRIEELDLLLATN